MKAQTDVVEVPVILECPKCKGDMFPEFGFFGPVDEQGEYSEDVTVWVCQACGFDKVIREQYKIEKDD